MKHEAPGNHPFPAKFLRVGLLTALFFLSVGSASAESIYDSAYAFTNFVGKPADAGDVPSGNGTATGTGNFSEAQFKYPLGVAVDQAGNSYVADTWNHKIRKVTPAGVVSTLAGSGGTQGGYVNGNGTAASFRWPSGVAVDGTGTVFVADTGNNAIRRITAAGEVTTYAGSSTGQPGSTDGTGDAARFSHPGAITVNTNGDLFVTDTINNTVRKITPKLVSNVLKGDVTTLAGLAGSPGSSDGTGSAARFNFNDSAWNLDPVEHPSGISVISNGYIFVADEDNHTIRQVSQNGYTTTVAGKVLVPGYADGTGEAARFWYPSGIAVYNGSELFVADRNNYRITRGVLQGGGVTITTTSPLPPATLATAYAVLFSASGGTAPYSWSATGLPAGLTMGSDGALTGTPNIYGTFTFTVSVTDSKGNSAESVFELKINALMIVGSITSGNAYVYQIDSLTVTGTAPTPPYVFNISGDTFLPAGLNYTRDGVISGTPYETGAFSVNISVRDANGLTGETTLAFSIGASVAPAITTTSLPDGTAGYSYSQQIVATGGYLPLQYALATGSSLPPGLSLGIRTGIISGTPTATGTYNFTVQASGNDSLASTKALSITVYSIPSITTGSPLTPGAPGLSYGQTLAASGGKTPYAWSLGAGSSLPDGLTLNPTTGTITGTPTTVGNSTFTIQLEDALGATASKPFSLTIISPPSITTVSPLASGVTLASYSQTLDATGVNTPFTWSLAAGSSLPDGLRLDATSGIISGIPTTEGTYIFTAQVTDQYDLYSTKTFTLSVSSLPQIETTSPLAVGTKGVVYSNTLNATGGLAPYTWAIAAGNLPAGLTLNATTGTITGTPSVLESASFTAQITDNLGRIAVFPFVLVISEPPTINTASPLTSGLADSPYTQALAATGGALPYAWSLAAESLLPDGLTLNPTTGIISGTPTAEGAFTFAVQISGMDGLSSNKTFSLAVNSKPTITTATPLPDGTRAVEYSQTLNETGGTAPYTWAVSLGSLPTGLSLGSSNGTISGTPTVVGTSTFSITITDSNGNFSAKSFTLTVNDPTIPTISTSALALGSKGSAYSQPLDASGGIAPYAWIVSSGSLPGGLTLNGTTGIISGTPATVGNSTFTIQVTDSVPNSSNKTFTLTVSQPPTITTGSTLPPVLSGTVYNKPLSATGGVTPYSWSLAPGSTLPAGLRLGLSTGTISGTPSTDGAYSFTVRVAGADGLFSTKVLTLTVYSLPAITTASPLPVQPKDVAYSQTFEASGGTTPYSWAVSSGSLPAGLTLNGTTGIISGTPTTVGNSTFAIEVTDFALNSSSKSFDLIISQTPTITTASPLIPNGVIDMPYSRTLAATGGSAPYSWTLVGGNLPAGLNFTPGNATISGTPTAYGTFNFTVQVAGSDGLASTKDFSLSVLAITTPNPLPISSNGETYSQTLAAAGGTEPYAWELAAGSLLPAGLTLNGTTGIISGTPTTLGNSTFTINATDSTAPAAFVATKEFTLTIGEGPLITTASPLPNGVTDSTYTKQLEATRGTPPYTWALVSGSLPVGLTLNATTGEISGTPVAEGDSLFTMQVVGSDGLSKTKQFNMTVMAITTPSPLASGAQGVAYIQSLAAAGGTAPYTWSISGGSLPASLTLNATTGIIDGIPAATGNSTFTITAADVSGNSASKNYKLLIGNPISITTPESLTSGVAGAAYTQTLAATATGVLPYTWSVLVGLLPEGLSLNSDGVISGSPVFSGSATITVQVTDANGVSTTKDLTLIVNAAAPTYSFSNFVGYPGGAGNVDGSGNAARFNGPASTATDSSGNTYVADTWNNVVRKITPAGDVTTLAGLAGSFGSADGTGNSARFNGPTGLAIDSVNNIYVSDTNNNTIRKIAPTGNVTTLAGSAGNAGSVDGTGDAARFYGPAGLALDRSGNLYVADQWNCTIRQVVISTGAVTTIAGSAESPGSNDGTGTAAKFNGPFGVAVNPAGTTLYVADNFNATIRSVTLPAAEVETLAGDAEKFGWLDGEKKAARFSNPMGVAVDAIGNVYVADASNKVIRMVTSSGNVTTVAGRPAVNGGVDGSGSAALFSKPQSVEVAPSGNITISDSDFNQTIRQMSPDGNVTTLVGSVITWGSANGIGISAQFNSPSGIVYDSLGNAFVADKNNNTIRKSSSLGVVTTFAGSPGIRGSSDGTGSVARFNGPTGLAIDTNDNIYVSDTNNNTIRIITPSGNVTTLAGLAGNTGSEDGTGSAARFSQPTGLALDSSGNIFVADTLNNTIRKVTQAGIVTTLAGTPGVWGYADGSGASAQFGLPSGVTVDTSTDSIFVSDSFYNTIRQVTEGGGVTTIAGDPSRSPGSENGTGSNSRFNQPRGLAIDNTRNILVVDTGNSVIRQVTQSGVVTTIGGYAPEATATDGVGAFARFSFPESVSVNSSGHLLVSDSANNRLSLGIPIAPAAPPVISTSNPLPGGIVGITYGFALSVTNGTSPFNWTLVLGNLPPGLTLNPDGTISGTPATIGHSSFAVQVSDITGLLSTKGFSLSVGGVSSGYMVWKSTVFSTSELADNTISSDVADPDGDGLSNLVEYAFGGDPMSADATAFESKVSLNGSNHLEITFYCNASLTGITYTVQSSSDLTTWTDIAQSVGGGLTAPMGVLSSVVDSGAGIRPVTVTDSITVSGQRFLRVNISLW